MNIDRFLIILLTGLTLGGCAANVNVTYQPDPARKSPLEQLKPLGVSLLAEDLRDQTERDRVGNRKNGFGQVIAPVVLKNQQPVTLVQEALQKEFANNGIQLVDAASMAPHKAITVRLRKYWVENKMNFFDISMQSTISADIVVDTVPAGGQPSTHAITGTAQDSRQMAFESAYEEVLTEAMTEFVHNFSRDPGILSSLKGAP